MRDLPRHLEGTLSPYARGELPQFYMLPWKYFLFYEREEKQGNKKRVVYMNLEK
jgi:hypothetical protein